MREREREREKRERVGDRRGLVVDFRLLNYFV